MKHLHDFLLMFLFLVGTALVPPSYVCSGESTYDYTAYTECKTQPEQALYNGGILKDKMQLMRRTSSLVGSEGGGRRPTFLLHNLPGATVYTFSSWVKIKGRESALVRAGLKSDSDTLNCIGSVIASSGCWSFLKGGFTLQSPSSLTTLYFEDPRGEDVEIEIMSASLQPFTNDEWRAIQQSKINTVRQRAVTIHVSDDQGNQMQGARIALHQVSKDFPLGSAISSTILENLPYQKWFAERFNAAVFEQELKWYSTEPKPGEVNYTIPDQMLEFVRSHKLLVRGHNIFWENPIYTPSWVRNLTGPDLERAVNSRIQSLMEKYKGEFIHWDVSNEVLHYDFYENKLGPNATLGFFETAHQADPLATLFMNEFNVVETCDDVNSTVDAYIAKLKQLQQGGVGLDGIGLEGHFTVPNPPLIRATLDKLATLGLPIWLTEIDISSTIDKQKQAEYLEMVLREGYSHPAVKGMMLWTALHPGGGCYEMCLTDNNLQNLPAGNVVDSLLEEWETGVIEGLTDGHGSYSFYGFLGDYNVHVVDGNKSVNSTFSLSQGDETRHFTIQL